LPEIKAQFFSLYSRLCIDWALLSDLKNVVKWLQLLSFFNEFMNVILLQT